MSPLLLPLCSESPSPLLAVCAHGRWCMCTRFYRAFLSALPSEVECRCWEGAARTAVVPAASWKSWAGVHWRGTWHLALPLTGKRKQATPLLSAVLCRQVVLRHDSMPPRCPTTACAHCSTPACHRQPYGTTTGCPAWVGRRTSRHTAEEKVGHVQVGVREKILWYGYMYIFGYELISYQK